MSKLAAYVKEGALAFLNAEYRILAIFVVVAGILLGIVSSIVETTHWFIVVAFVIGAVFSAVAGNIGMRIATEANVRTTEAARTSLSKGLKVSFLVELSWVRSCWSSCIWTKRSFYPFNQHFIVGDVDVTTTTI